MPLSSEKTLGPEHPDANRTRFNLSRLLLLIPGLTEALALGEAALAAHYTVLGWDHARTDTGPNEACFRADVSASSSAKPLRSSIRLP